MAYFFSFILFIWLKYKKSNVYFWGCSALLCDNDQYVTLSSTNYSFTMFSKTSKYVMVTLKALIILICSVLFILLMQDTWDDFNKEATTMSVKLIYDPQNGPFLPCITVCPWKGFKKAGLFFRKKDYDENTFSFSEIFNEK